MFKKIMKVFGIISACIVGVIGISIGIFALMGGFEEKVVGLSKIYFDDTEGMTDKLIFIEDDTTMVINYLPNDATETTLKTIVVGSGVTVPETVTVGKEFTISVVKDANGRNVGGNAEIEFVSNKKNSVSNLIAPCRLKVVVDVPVEDSDISFSSSLKYVSSADTSRQYIIAKNKTNTTFYLYANKDNIFDINQWSDVENKKLYFYYYDADGNAVEIDVANSATTTPSGEPVDCYYSNLDQRYVLNFYPSDIDTSTFRVEAKSHRSYQIQQEFIDLGLTAFEDNYLKKSFDQIGVNNTVFNSLLSKYSKFLTKYYKNYFALENPEALTFFESYMTNSGDIILTSGKEILDTIKKSLNYVYVSSFIDFYISDVKVNTFTVDSGSRDMSLIDIVNGEKLRTEDFIVMGNSSEYSSLVNYFVIKLEATSLDDSNTEIDVLAKQSLLENMTIDVLLYDKSGKSQISGSNTEINTNLGLTALPANSNSLYNYKQEIAELLKANKEKAETSPYLFGYNNQYLTIEKDENNIWTLTKKVPSKAEDFQIYLMFSLAVNDEDGRKVFYDFIKVNVLEDSDTSTNGLKLHNNIEYSDTMYIYDDTTDIGQTLESGWKQLNIQSLTKPADIYADTTFENYKLFAYAGVDDGSGNIIVDENSVFTASYFEQTRYYPILDINSVEVDSITTSRLCTFTDLEGKMLKFTSANGNKIVQYAKIDEENGGTKNIVYAYELTWEEIKALSASENKVIFFASYVLTDADNNPIDREGWKIFNERNQLIERNDNNQVKVIDTTKQVSFKNASGDIIIDGVVNYKDEVVNYIGLNAVDFTNTITAKSVLENLYYYSILENEVVITDGTNDVTVSNYALRNSASSSYNLVKLITDNSYINMLTVLPYNIDELIKVYTYPNLIEATLDLEEKARLEKELSQIHKKLTNLMLAYDEALTDQVHPLNFAVYINANVSGEQASVTDESYASIDINRFNPESEGVKLTGIDGIADGLTIHPTYISINAIAKTLTNNRPIIRLAEDYVNNVTYAPTNDLVTIDISEVNISDFTSLFSGDIALTREFTTSGKVIQSGSTDDFWTWKNDNKSLVLYDKYIGTENYLPNIFKSLEGIVTGNDSNISTNITTGINTEGVLTFNKELFDSSIIDISLLSEDYIETCILRYLFNFDNLTSTDQEGWKTWSAIRSGLKTYTENNLGTTTDFSISRIYSDNVNMSTNPNESLGLGVYINVTDVQYKDGEGNYISDSPSNFYKYFGYANTTQVQGTGTDKPFIRVKLNNDGTLPLYATTEDFIVTFDMEWTFTTDSGNTNKVTKTFTVDAKFEAPTFETTTNDIISIDENNREVDLAQYLKAYYDAAKTTELNARITYNVSAYSNVAYFVDSTNQKIYTTEGYTIDGNGSETILHVYDCMNTSTISVICSLQGCEDIVLTIKVEPTIELDDTTLNNNVPFVSYVDSIADYSTSGKVVINSNEIATKTYIYNSTDKSLTYNLGNYIQIKEVNNNTTNYLSAINITSINGLTGIGDYVKCEGSNIILTGNMYTTLTIKFTITVDDSAGGLTINPNDSLLTNEYTITIYPVIKVNDIQGYLSNVNEYKYYSYNVNNKLLEDGYSLYNNVFGLQYLTAELSYVDIQDLDSNLMGIMRKANSDYGSFEYYWDYNANYLVNDQFYTKTGDSYDKNELYSEVYSRGGSENAVEINNGVLEIRPIAVSYVLPISFNFNGYIGEKYTTGANSTYTVDVLIPIAGYTIKTTSDKITWKESSYDYDNHEFNIPTINLTAGQRYVLTEYVTVGFASGVGNFANIWQYQLINYQKHYPQLNFINEIGSVGVDGKIYDNTSPTPQEIIDENGIIKDTIVINDVATLLSSGMQLHINELISITTVSVDFSLHLYKYEFTSGSNKGYKVIFDNNIEIPIKVDPSKAISLGTIGPEGSEKSIVLIVDNNDLKVTYDSSTLGELDALNIANNSNVDGFVAGYLAVYELNTTLLNKLDVMYIINSTDKITYTINGLNTETNNTKIVFEFDKDIIDQANSVFSVTEETSAICTITIYGSDGSSSVSMYFNTNITM